MMGYSFYGGYGSFRVFSMIFNLIILVILIWAVSSYFDKRSGSSNNSDERLTSIERQIENNRESLDKLLKKLE
ncbi:putative membrane protein [Methanohalophilus levihalophilus]|uniref:hypothetical protein n=1 Tax=Methanohalophilus levihalophilus TaxID=1431282 RepID=UPI001AEA6564|nr:hypothetical protein [Methanohalophilus levihalophilus]MBP2030797.1 putative membrane protein [Methanohalophilus levihalophilus]